MADVNFVEYGENAERIFGSMEDTSEFMATNGYALGSVLGAWIVLFIFLALVIMILWFGKSFIKKFISNF